MRDYYGDPEIFIRPLGCNMLREWLIGSNKEIWSSPRQKSIYTTLKNDKMSNN